MVDYLLEKKIVAFQSSSQQRQTCYQKQSFSQYKDFINVLLK